MLKISRLFSFFVLLVVLSKVNSLQAQDRIIPYYFIAIHVEPFYGFPEEIKLKLRQEQVDTLREMVRKAEQNNFKLTIMLAPIYTKYFSNAEINAWKAKGHEIAAHHHGAFHPAWDGYSGIPQFETMDIRRQILAREGRPVEPWWGDLNRFENDLLGYNSTIQSGCMNEERDKREMPKKIRFATCSDYSNQLSRFGQRVNDLDPMKAINEFIVSAEVGGVRRYWLSHQQIIRNDQVKNAMNAFKTVVNSGKGNKTIMGTVNHPANVEEQNYNTYLQMLAQFDPQGSRSLTLAEAITKKILPVYPFRMINNTDMVSE